MICHFCEIYISSKDSLDHYKRYHIIKKDHYIPMKTQHKIADYMTIFDLYQSKKINCSDDWMPELKIIKKEFICKFPRYHNYAISEPSMRKHYYIHQKHISKNFKNWESTILQTFFDDQYRKYIKLFISALMIDISQ